MNQTKGYTMKTKTVTVEETSINEIVLNIENMVTELKLNETQHYATLAVIWENLEVNKNRVEELGVPMHSIKVI